MLILWRKLFVILHIGKTKPFVEIPGCGKWAGRSASRVWVNQWEKCTMEIMTKVRHEGKNVVDGKKMNTIN